MPSISRRTALKGLVASSFALQIPHALMGTAHAEQEHPIMRAIREGKHGLGRVKRCKDDPGVAKFTVDMTEHAKVGLSIVSDFGSKWSSECKIRQIGRGSLDPISRGQGGLDIWAPRGTPVIAAIDGKVSDSHFDELSGNTIKIQSEDAAVWPTYWHLEHRLVKVGDKVRRGDIIGTVGSTGRNASGVPGLHFVAQEAWADTANPHPYWIKSDPNLLLAAAFGDKIKEKARVTLYRPGEVYDIPAGDHRVLTYPIPGFTDMPYFLRKLEEMQKNQ